MILITGGVKSGKSSFALELAGKFRGPRAFIATCEAFDREMKAKIKRHKSDRGPGFALYEEPTDIFRPLRAGKAGVYVIDCVTVWVSNLLYYKKDIKKYFGRFLGSLRGNEIIVTNEAGLGVIPDNEMSRGYVNHLGEINKLLGLQDIPGAFETPSAPVRDTPRAQQGHYRGQPQEHAHGVEARGRLDLE